MFLFSLPSFVITESYYNVNFANTAYSYFLCPFCHSWCFQLLFHIWHMRFWRELTYIKLFFYITFFQNKRKLDLIFSLVLQKIHLILFKILVQSVLAFMLEQQRPESTEPKYAWRILGWTKDSKAVFLVSLWTCCPGPRTVGWGPGCLSIKSSWHTYNKLLKDTTWAP